MDITAKKLLLGKCDKKLISNQEHYSFVALEKMNSLRKRGQLCDVVIKVEGHEFLAHRVVLAASSDYFDAMFSSGMAETDQLEVELKSISPEIMEALLEYIYTGQVRVSMDNVQDLLPAASLVQIEGVKVACSNFLLAEVDSSNVLGIRRFAELHNCTELEAFTRNYAAHNFESVAESEEFIYLTCDELIDMIVREDLYIDCEESVYKAVMRWVYHHPSDRAQYLAPLLRNVRLSVMSVRFLTDVVDKNLLIRKSLECRDLVDDAKRFHLRPDLRHEMRELRYRQRDGGDKYLVVIGGFVSDQRPSDSVEMFNPRTCDWSELPDLPTAYRYVAACSLDTRVYVIGGFDGRERLNTVCVLDIAQCEEGWRWLIPMHYKRGLSAACTNKGLIYVCGGFDGHHRLRSLEVYHPKIDEWRILPEMATAREGAGLVVVDDTLYCLGGYDGFNLLNTMEAFDIRRGSWSYCKPMYMRRSGAGCALLDHTIYVCGGYGGADGQGPIHLDTVEAYNTRLGQWTLVASMNVPRCYVGACPLAGKIYVAAGYNGSNLLDILESYDPIENTWWLHNESRMNHERCDTGMCVVRFLASAVSSDSNFPTPRTSVQTIGAPISPANRCNNVPVVASSSISVSSSANHQIESHRALDDTTANCIPPLSIAPRMGEANYTNLPSPFVEPVHVHSTMNADTVTVNATSSCVAATFPSLVSTSHSTGCSEESVLRNNNNNNNTLARNTIRHIYKYPQSHCKRQYEQCHQPSSSLLLPVSGELGMPKTQLKQISPFQLCTDRVDEIINHSHVNSQSIRDSRLSLISSLNTTESSDFLSMRTFTYSYVESISNEISLNPQSNTWNSMQPVSTNLDSCVIEDGTPVNGSTSETPERVVSEQPVVVVDSFHSLTLNKSSELSSSNASILSQHGIQSSEYRLNCNSQFLLSDMPLSVPKRFCVSSSSLRNLTYKHRLFRSMDALNFLCSHQSVRSKSAELLIDVITDPQLHNSSMVKVCTASSSNLTRPKFKSNINLEIHDDDDDDDDDCLLGNNQTIRCIDAVISNHSNDGCIQVDELSGNFLHSNNLVSSKLNQNLVELDVLADVSDSELDVVHPACSSVAVDLHLDDARSDGEGEEADNLVAPSRDPAVGQIED